MEFVELTQEEVLTCYKIPNHRVFWKKLACGYKRRRKWALSYQSALNHLWPEIQKERDAAYSAALNNIYNKMVEKFLRGDYVTPVPLKSILKRNTINTRKGLRVLWSNNMPTMGRKSYERSCSKLYRQEQREKKKRKLELTMKSLMESGDTDRIIFYANVSKHRDIYMLAANYLQTTEWRGKQKIIDLIVQYYSKAQSYESLAGFYENVAEYAIEDLRDYKRALEEYKKAESSLSDLSACGAHQYEDQYHSTQSKIQFITKFLLIKEKMTSDPDGALLEIKKLMEDPKAEMAVRTGDVYALIVEHYANRGNVEETLTVLKEMRKFIPSKNLPRFLTPKAISNVEELMRNNPSRR